MMQKSPRPLTQRAWIFAASFAALGTLPAPAEEGFSDPEAAASAVVELVASLRSQAESPLAERLAHAETFVAKTHASSAWLLSLESELAGAAPPESEARTAWIRAWQRAQAADWVGWGEDTLGLKLDPPRLESEDLAVVTGAFERAGKEPYEVRLMLGKEDGAWRIADLISADRSAWRDRALRCSRLGREGAARLGGALAAEAARATESPAATVAALHAALLDVMRSADELGYRGRYDRLAPIVVSTHDLEVVAYLTIRRTWPTLSTAEQTEFSDAFRELSVATYAARFDGFGGETFERGEPEPGARGGFVVPAVIVKSNGEKISLEYILHRRLGRWMILNVIADGVSDLALKTAEYGELVQKDGFGRLLALMRERIAEQAAEHG